MLLVYTVQRLGLEKDFEVPFAMLLKKIYSNNSTRLISFGALLVIIYSQYLFSFMKYFQAGLCCGLQGGFPEIFQETCESFSYRDLG